MDNLHIQQEIVHENWPRAKRQETVQNKDVRQTHLGMMELKNWPLEYNYQQSSRDIEH